MIRRSLENIEELEKLYILLVLSVTTVIFFKNISASFFFRANLMRFWLRNISIYLIKIYN
jgi:hypothetical protein